MESAALETIGPEDAAPILRCTAEQVELLARTGEIPGVKFGRSWVFVRADLIDWIRERGREEAQERRERKQPAPAPGYRLTRQRRSAPPVLPQPAPAIAAALSPRL